MHKRFTIILRAAIAAALLVSLFGQILVIPNSGMEELRRYFPEGATATTYAVLGILGVVCVQVSMGAVWMLLGMVERDAIFTSKAFRWIDLIIGAAGAATLLAFGTAVHLMFAPMSEMDFLGLWLPTVACTGAGVCFILLMAVMRGLLRKATDLETEMAEVV